MKTLCNPSSQSQLLLGRWPEVGRAISYLVSQSHEIFNEITTFLDLSIRHPHLLKSHKNITALDVDGDFEPTKANSMRRALLVVRSFLRPKIFNFRLSESLQGIVDHLILSSAHILTRSFIKN